MASERPRRPPGGGPIDLAILEFLRTTEGQDGLRAAAAVRSLPIHRRLDALPKALDRSLRRALLQQDDLRQRAAGKCPEALQQTLLFLEGALEQATPWRVATYRAAQWPAGHSLYDLGAGQGLDCLAALSAKHRVAAYEQDPLRAALLRSNADTLGCGDLLTVHIEDLEGAADATASAFLDPDRRPGGERVWDPEAFSPPVSRWPLIAERFARLLVKAPPVLDAPELDAHPQEIVSLDGRVRERGVRFGDWPGAPARQATALRRSPDAPIRQIAGSGQAWPEAGVAQPGTWLLDPDPAVTVAGLVGELAEAAAARPVHPRIAYLLSETAPADDLPTQAYRIDAIVGTQPKRVRAWLRERNIARYEVKTRGVEDDAATWRKRIGPPPHKHGEAAVLCFTRDRDDRWCCIASVAEAR